MGTIHQNIWLWELISNSKAYAHHNYKLYANIKFLIFDVVSLQSWMMSLILIFYYLEKSCQEINVSETSRFSKNIFTWHGWQCDKPLRRDQDLKLYKGRDIWQICTSDQVSRGQLRPERVDYDRTFINNGHVLRRFQSL